MPWETAAEEIVGRKRAEAYDSLGEALAVNGEIKEAKGRSVDDTRADWKRKAQTANYTTEDAAACGRVAEQLAADGTTAVNKGGSRSMAGVADGSDRSKEIHGAKQNRCTSAFTVGLSRSQEP